MKEEIFDDKNLEKDNYYYITFNSNYLAYLNDHYLLVDAKILPPEPDIGYGGFVNGMNYYVFQKTNDPNINDKIQIAFYRNARIREYYFYVPVKIVYNNDYDSDYDDDEDERIKQIKIDKNYISRLKYYEEFIVEVGDQKLSLIQCNIYKTDYNPELNAKLAKEALENLKKQEESQYELCQICGDALDNINGPDPDKNCKTNCKDVVKICANNHLTHRGCILNACNASPINVREQMGFDDYVVNEEQQRRNKCPFCLTDLLHLCDEFNTVEKVEDDNLPIKISGGKMQKKIKKTRKNKKYTKINKKIRKKSKKRRVK